MPLIIASFSSFLVGFSKCGISGAAILSIPLMVEAFPAKTAVGLMLPVLICGDIMALSFYRKFAQWRLIFRLFPYTLAGIIAGYFLLGIITDPVLKTVIGIIILSLLLLKVLSSRYDLSAFTGGIYLAPLLGIMAGVATILANGAGPLMAIYLLWMGVKKKQFIGTGAWYFFLLNCTKVPFLVHREMITASSLLFDLKLIPFVVAGSLVGVWVVKRVNQSWFEKIIMLLTAAAGIKLLI